MVRKSVCLALAGLAAMPAAASAACAARSAAEFADAAPLVFLGRALDGGRFRVVAYEKGGGGAEWVAPTGQPESIQPRPGELWRIYGRPEGDVVATGACFGSHAIMRSLDPFALYVAGRTFTPAPSTLAGNTSPTAAPRLRTRHASIRLVSPVPLAYVRVMRRGRVLTTATSGPDHVQWTVPVPRGTSRLVIDTGDRAYAGALSRLSHR